MRALPCAHRAPAVLTLLRHFSMLNTVLELWRYPDATACMAARQAAREAPEWKAAIAKVAPMVQARPRGAAQCPSRS